MKTRKSAMAAKNTRVSSGSGIRSQRQMRAVAEKIVSSPDKALALLIGAEICDHEGKLTEVYLAR